MYKRQPSGCNPANPARVAASTTRAYLGAGPGGGGSAARPFRSRAKKNRKITYSTATTAIHGTAISAANPAKLSPLAANASRFVRLETGSSSDAELARWVQA